MAAGPAKVAVASPGVIVHLADTRERLRAASAALAAYKLRSSLSMLGVVLGIAAVIAMMSVSEGAAREALTQVESLGLDNIVIRSERQSMAPRTSGALTVADADRLESVVPLVRASSPLLDRMVKVSSEHGYDSRADGRGPRNISGDLASRHRSRPVPERS